MVVNFPVESSFSQECSLNLREVKFDSKIPAARIEGVLIFIGGNIQMSKKADPIVVPNFSHRATFALVHEPGKAIEIRAEPLIIEANPGFSYEIKLIQVALLPYIGEENAEAILTYMRLMSLLLNSDIVVKHPLGIISFPISTLETIPLGPNENLRPHTIKL
jgi:hypothetical protein